MTTAQSTLDDVWLLFKETNLKFQETDRKFQETNLQFQETDRKFQEINLQFQETDLRIQDTGKLIKELSVSQKETDRLFKEMNKKLGDLGNRLGEFVQEMVRPAVVRLFRDRGIAVHQVMRNIEAFDDEIAIEIDLLVINREQAIAVECKSRLSIEDVNEHLARLDKFKQLFPQYQGLNLMGAVAGMVVLDEAAKYAYRRGLFVLAQSGDSVLIRNDDKFMPKQW
ncbi:MAG: hypothetical protein ACOYN4_21905 [Bacteroidales bacterium]